ncbi:hypothetical protein ACFT25_27510 [Streptomyces hydrogenans]|uniref:hypothetical protein n=1 Tax=Streptomyces hydrogenans TaxID=1873719 RepID=UPI00363415B3
MRPIFSPPGATGPDGLAPWTFPWPPLSGAGEVVRGTNRTSEHGGTGDDAVGGGNGNDVLRGEAGALAGGNGADTLDGGSGTETRPAGPGDTGGGCP